MGSASKLLALLSTPLPRLCPRSSFFRLPRPSYFPPPLLPAAVDAQRRFPSSCSHPRHGPPPSAARRMHTQTGVVRVDCREASVSTATHKPSFHPWPEWSKLVEHLTTGGYADRRVAPPQGGEHDDDSFLVSEELPEDFTRLAGACLLYAREWPDLLRSLSKGDINIVVENGSPFLFKNGSNSVRRMKSFVGSEGGEVPESEQACTVDVMRYLLSYACNSLISTGGDETRCRELVVSSVRNLLCELVKISGDIQESNVTDPTARHSPFEYEQSPKPLRQNIEMKRGDWICPKCNFMNFARNVKCLECDEARPKRQPTSGEWECPQCDFFNYGRNMTCLRCDCKRPGEISESRKPGIEQLLHSVNIDRAEVERRLAENDEKAERWFSKVSQLDDSSDLSSAVADEDFPEIMPLRKGTNRFVVSTRKTPLERRLANAQYRNNLGNEGSYMRNDSPGRMGSDKMSESAISQTLDRILGRSSATSGTNSSAASGSSGDAGNQSVSGETRATGSRFTSQSRNSGYVPSGKASEPLYSGNFNSLTGSENVNNQTVSKTIKDSSDPTGGWSKNSSQLPGVANVQSATLNDGFPKIAPTHEEENRFGISNRIDHSLTSMNYKRRRALDQANNSNFVPFVPFPPDYFAKKDKQQEARSFTEKSATESSASAAVGNDKSVHQRSEENRVGYSYEGGDNNIGRTRGPEASGHGWNSELSRTSLGERKVGQQINNVWNYPGSGGGAFAREVPADGVNASGNLNQQQVVGNDKSVHQRSEENRVGYSYEGGANNIGRTRGPEASGHGWNSELSRTSLGERKVGQQINNVWNYPGSGGGAFAREVPADGVNASGNLNQQQVENPQKTAENRNHAFPGKSLEGSAVTEPDPLDMSEEAKAQRWFRRVAQIKDISELSKIPDEDFPEIMPMRKGVNRFVVSKRKTPLERRLTSPQYRRNLPIVSSEPGKDPTRE